MTTDELLARLHVAHALTVDNVRFELGDRAADLVEASLKDHLARSFPEAEPDQRPHPDDCPHAAPCPDCATGKHGACTGAAWCQDHDQPAICPCTHGAQP